MHLRETKRLAKVCIRQQEEHSFKNVRLIEEAAMTSTIGLLLLAAGASRRMKGEPKQLLIYEGESLLRRAANTALASQCRPVIIVTGAHRERVEREVADLPLEYRSLSFTPAASSDCFRSASGERASEVFGVLDMALWRWLTGRFALMLINGGLTAGALWLLGLPLALALRRGCDRRPHHARGRRRRT